MYFRVLGAACAVILTSLSLAQAAEPQIIVLDDGSKAVSAKISEAAEKLCTAARVHDVFDDYGSQAECVAETLSTVSRRSVDEATPSASQTLAYGK